MQLGFSRCQAMIGHPLPGRRHQVADRLAELDSVGLRGPHRRHLLTPSSKWCAPTMRELLDLLNTEIRPTPA